MCNNAHYLFVQCSCNKQEQQKSHFNFWSHQDRNRGSPISFQYTFALFLFYIPKHTTKKSGNFISYKKHLYKIQLFHIVYIYMYWLLIIHLNLCYTTAKENKALTKNYNENKLKKWAIVVFTCLFDCAAAAAVIILDLL